MTVQQTSPARNHGKTTGFTNTDLDNLIRIVNGAPMEPHRFNVAAVRDFLAERKGMEPAEAVVELLTMIRNA